MSIIYIDIPDPFKTSLLRFAKSEIYQHDVISYEEHLHITLMFGLHSNDVREVKESLGEFIPIRVMFGKTSMFMADSYRPTDVVKIDAFGQSMVRLRRVLETLPHTSRYKTFTPHITLAYVEPHTAIQYIGNNPAIGHKFISDHVVFATDTERYKIFCSGEIEKQEIN